MGIKTQSVSQCCACRPLPHILLIWNIHHLCILQWVPPVHFVITKPLMLRIFLSVIIFSYLYSACCKVLGEQYVGYYFQVSHNLWINHVHNQCYWSSYLLDSFITLMVWFRGHSFCRCGITWQFRILDYRSEWNCLRFRNAFSCHLLM